MKYDKKNALRIIVNAAHNYKYYLQDKTFLIIYNENGKQKYVEVTFLSNHFLHLTGVTTQLTAKRFYQKCINHKLSLHDFELDKTGKCIQKLMALPVLHELLHNSCLIGDFINSGIVIKADYFVGNTKAVLSVGFRKIKHIDFPVTLYREDVRKLTQPTNKVLAIFVKGIKEVDYSKYTYLSKGVEINKLLESDDMKNLIKIDEE